MDAEMGGCDPALLPTFEGLDCDQIAQEFGEFLDTQTVAVLEGPEMVDGNGRSVRLKHRMVVLTTLAGRRLDELDLRGECDIVGFLATAEQRFSAELMSGVGAALYDGDPVATYEEWRTELERTLALIEPDASSGG
jgi:hypothetical protein